MSYHYEGNEAELAAERDVLTHIVQALEEAENVSVEDLTGIEDGPKSCHQVDVLVKQNGRWVRVTIEARG